MRSTGVIFKRTLDDSRRIIIGWGIGLALYMVMMIVVYPSMKDMQQLNEMLQLPFFQAMVGSEVTDITSPGGFLGMYLFLYMPLLLAVFAILYGLGITAAEEERGTLDVLLGLPVPRWQVIVEKFLAAIVILVLIILLMLIGAAIGLIFTPALQVDWGALILAHLNILPITLVLIGLTLLLSTLLRSRGLVGGILIAFITASYFLKTLADLAAEPLSNMRYLSIFNYYGGATIITQGMNWGGFLLLSVITIALVVLSLFTFQRRDLAV